MNSILKRYLACGLSAVLFATGCTEEDLNKRADEGYVEIVLDWGDARPNGKRFDFYPVDGGKPLTFLPDAPECDKSKTGIEGFKGSLPSGEYRMLVANCEEGQFVEFRNEHHFESAAFFVSHVPTRADEGLSNRIEHVGRLMFTHRFDSDSSFDSDEILKVSYQQSLKRSATPKSYVKHVRLNFRIQNPESITKCEGVFVGVAESINCVTESCSAAPASIDFTAEPMKQRDSEVGFTAVFSVLDLIDPGDKISGVHSVHLTLTKTDGTKLTTTVDVTNAVQDIIDVSGGTIPLDIPLSVELKVLGNDLSAEVEAWPEGSGGGDVVSGSLE